MLQAALLDCLFRDPLPFPENGFVVAEVDVSARGGRFEYLNNGGLPVRLID